MLSKSPLFVSSLRHCKNTVQVVDIIFYSLLGLWLVTWEKGRIYEQKLIVYVCVYMGEPRYLPA